MFEHLFDRHKNVLSYSDILDTKVAQIIAFNGLILSITLFTATNAKTTLLFFLGMLIIIASILMGVYTYMGRDYFIGASTKFFTDYDKFQEGVGIQKLKKQLILDINRNEKSYNSKAKLFDQTIYLMLIGLLLLLVGYYV